MNLTDMRAIVRRDLHDEDSNNYRWTDDELDRHIVHAVREFSERIPYEPYSALHCIAVLDILLGEDRMRAAKDSTQD